MYSFIQFYDKSQAEYPLLMRGSRGSLWDEIIYRRIGARGDNVELCFINYSHLRLIQKVNQSSPRVTLLKLNYLKK